jgi:hypothetical protein
MSWIDGLSLVSVELSNVCPHAARHPRCPLHGSTEAPHWLPEGIILDVFNALGAEGFAGNVLLQQYNEPLADPRLFFLMDELRARVPFASLQMWVSSWLLTDQLVTELAGHGCARLGINRYDAAEQRREFKAPNSTMVIEHRDGGHDDRRDLYTREPAHAGKPFCGLPSRELVIHHTGAVGLCCFDWQRSVVFDYLTRQRLPAIMAGEARQSFLARCASEGRHAHICQRCAHRVAA